MNRTTIIISKGATGWDVHQGRDGDLSRMATDQAFATAHKKAMDLLFPARQSAGHDFIQTNRTIDELRGTLDQPGPAATILLPEGGDAMDGIWTSHSYATNRTGGQFHVTSLREMLEEDFRGLDPWADLPRVNEREVRRDWRAIEFSPGAISRQAEAVERNARLALFEASMAEDKQASVRIWGTSSPYFNELYGHLSYQEWDAIWQSFQAEAA